MQEQKKYQIEKVEHDLPITSHTCCVIDYYEESGVIYQWNYNSYFYAKTNGIFDCTVGIWRIKSRKNNR